MRHFSNKPSMRMPSGSNVTTPLRLVSALMLVSLSITSLAKASNDLNLPAGRHPGAPLEPDSAIQVTLSKDNRITLNDEPVALSQLTARLVTLREERPDIAVVLRVRRELSLQQIVDLTEAVKAANIAKIGMISAPATDLGSTVQVTLSRDNRITLNDEPVALEQLTARLVALREERPDISVVLRVREELSVQQVVDVTEAVKAANITRIGMRKVPEKSARPE